MSLNYPWDRGVTAFYLHFKVQMMGLVTYSGTALVFQFAQTGSFLDGPHFANRHLGGAAS